MVDVDGSLNNAGGAAGATFPMLASEYTTRIDNAHQLQLMAMNTGATYALSQNIDASTTGSGTDVWNSTGFIPIGNSSAAFVGVFDGLGHTVSGLTINWPSINNVGLIGVAGAGSVIEEVGLVGGSITGSDNVGALVGESSGTVSNSYSTANVNGDNNVGGLVGNNYGTVSSSYAAGSVRGASGVGGLVGQNDALTGNSGAVINGYATGSVIGTSETQVADVGGLVGRNLGSVSGSYATGSVSGASYVGGLVGYNELGNRITNSYATGSVAGAVTGSGGLVGVNRGTISESYAKGAVSGYDDVGGLLGTNSGSVSGSHATGNVSGGTGYYVGGLVGESDGVGATVTTSYATGKVTGASYVGGLVGINAYGATISSSYAKGSVSGTDYDVGGLAGQSSGAVSESYATGSVAGAGNGVGGLVGESLAAVSNSYATGSVTGGSLEVGGLLGKNDGESPVSNSYATGKVSGVGDVGGLVGWCLVGYNVSPNVSFSFWNVTTSGLTTSAGGTGLTTAQMQNESTFMSAGWNFTSIWYMPSGSYPLLQAFESTQ
jgi:hypothetical protein